MATPFKMKNQVLRDSAKTGSPMQANYASPAKFIYGKKTTTKNDDGSTTSTRKNILTGGTKTVTKSADGTKKTVQKMNKDKGRATVKVKSKKGDRVTKTKTKVSNYRGTDDYKITKQKQTKKTKGVRGSKVTSKMDRSIPGVESGFQDPRLDSKGNWKNENFRETIPSYAKADKRYAKTGKVKIGRR